MARLTPRLAVLLALLAGSAGIGPPAAVEISNSASGTLGEGPLDLTRATVRLDLAGAVTSVLAEIEPSSALPGSVGNRFVYDLLPTIGPLDSGVRVVEISVPAGWGAVSVGEVSIGGSVLAPSCPTPGAGEFCATVAPEAIRIELGARVTETLTRIRTVFTADAPSQPGTSEFPSTVADDGAPQATTPGDADGEPDNANGIVVEVAETQGIVLRIDKTVSRHEAVIGDVTTWSVVVRNTTASDVVSVRIADRIPPGFQYLSGSARLDARPIPDPTGSRTVVFHVGTVPALADANGNGTADPGEPGYLVLTYQLVVGSGAKPGAHSNEAVAIDFCDACAISNTDRDTVEVLLDPVFDLGTIVGKVFRDANGDGAQQDGESGVPRAMVALDDGTYALTDEEGRYHFPAVRPGHRLVKLNLLSLMPGSRAAGEESRIVAVTPGLMARANFGVVTPSETESVGAPEVVGVSVLARTDVAPIEVRGSVDALSLLVNGLEASPLPVEVEVRVETLEGSARVTGGKLDRPVRFSVLAGAGVARWTLTVEDGRGGAVRRLSGEGAPPPSIEWDGTGDDGRVVSGGEIYAYRIEAELADGGRVSSPTRLVGIGRSALIAVHLTGEAFDSGKHALSPRARAALDRVAEILRKAPEERIVVEGHTDDRGSEALNLGLSRRRAEAALAYLTERQGLSEDRFALRARGESEPVASNATEEGRALNRRVEIEGQVESKEDVPVLRQIKTAPGVAINGVPAPVGAFGRFSASVPEPSATAVEVAMTGSRGAGASVRVPVPRIEVLAPAGELAVPYGEVSGPCRSAAPTDRPADSPAAWCRVTGRTEPGNTVEIAGVAAEVAPDGGFSGEVPLGPGRNAVALVARNPEGVSRLATVEIVVTDRDGSGGLLVLSEGVPSLRVNLPPRGVRIAQSRLEIAGVAEPGARLEINGEAVALEPDGSFLASLDLPPGRSTVVLEVKDGRGRTGRIEREVEVARDELFLMAFADGKIGRLAGKGYLEGAGLDGESEVYREGRLAFYLKGRILGKYLVTSSFDSAKGSSDRLFGALDPGAESRLLTHLDPDKLYPVYGDGSTVVYDAQSRGKFYLALDGDTLHAVVGNYPLSLADTELAGYQRTLYGGRVAYQSLSRTKYGQPDTAVVVFGAEVEQVHVRDEVRATGGSLYYLSHRDVIEGSEDVALVVRDRITGLVLERRRQARDIDYLVKYPEGRLMFQRPIPSVVDGGPLFSPGVPPGNPVFLEAGYETVAGGFEKAARGGRVRQQIGDHVAVGATYVEDEAPSGRYELAAGDVEIRLAEGTRLVAEYADSAGSGATTFASEDGGLTYAEEPVTAGGAGRAWRAAAEVDAGEWFGRPGRVRLRAYVKDVDPGFFSNGTFREAGTEKAGASATWKPGGADTFVVRFDRELREGDPSAGTSPTELRTTAAQWGHESKRWGVACEYLGTESESGGEVGAERRSAHAAARGWIRLGEKLTGRVDAQRTLSGEERDQATVGVQYQALPSLALELRGTDGTLGRSAQGGAVLKVGESQIYLTEKLAEDRAGEKLSTVLGARSPIGRSSRIYTEYQWETFDGGQRLNSLVGLQRQWDLGPGFRFLLSGEATQVDAEAGASRRTAVAGSLSYSKPGRFTWVTRDEWRRDGGSRESEQIFTFNQIDYRLNDDLSVLGRWRFSRTRSRETGEDEARFEERVIGLGYRPVRNDRLNVLARYTQIFDRRPTISGDPRPSSSRTDVASVDGILQLTPRIEWVSKLAFRDRTSEECGYEGVSSRSRLGIQRLNWLFWNRFELGAEYRLLEQRLARDRRQGWLGELMWQPARNFRFGVGYNFTDFSDDEYSENDFRAGGWFVRAQARY